MSRVGVKVCGLTDPETAAACVAAGADWIGLNFYPGSPRYVDPAHAAAIVRALPGADRAVGLFVDRPVAEVVSVAARVGLTTVQLHGQEPADDLPGFNGLQVVKAFRLGDQAAVEALRRYLARVAALGLELPAILVDAFVPGQAGGTGQTIADDLLDQLPPLPRLILAGGLTPENVADRVARRRPWMVDVASGVESAPGVKDLARVAAFLAAVRRGSGDRGQERTVAP